MGTSNYPLGVRGPLHVLKCKGQILDTLVNPGILDVLGTYGPYCFVPDILGIGYSILNMYPRMGTLTHVMLVWRGRQREKYMF